MKKIQLLPHPYMIIIAIVAQFSYMWFWLTDTIILHPRRKLKIYKNVQNYHPQYDFWLF